MKRDQREEPPHSEQHAPCPLAGRTLYQGLDSKVPGIMLTLNAMPHEPHRFLASMLATGREPALPPDLVFDTSPSLATEDAPGYVKTIQQRLQLTHQQMTAPPAAPTPNPYHKGSLIYVLTTPPERTSKLAPRWKGPFRVCHVPNEYQVTYKDDGMERTVHINQAKPAKFTAPDLPEPVPPAESPRPSLGYLTAGLAWKSTKPHTPPVAPREAPMAPPAAPEVPVDRSSPVAPANHHPEPARPRRRSPRLHPEPGQAHAILGRPSAPQPQSQPRPHAVNSSSHQRSPMARVYPLTIGYREALGPKANPLSFASLRLVNLHSGRSQYLSTLKQLTDALPKTEDPTSHFALRGHIARPGQHHLRRSMRAAIWILLPSDRMFLRDSASLRYYLARQGRRAVLRGGDVTGRPWENSLNWIPDPAPATSRDHGIEQLPLSSEPERPKEEKENCPLHLTGPGYPGSCVPGG